MNDSSLLLEIENLKISLELGGLDTNLVEEVSLTMQQGEILALVGESGSGKTLSAKSVLQLLPENARTQGKVLLDGSDVLTLRGTDIKRIRGEKAAMIFQEPSSALNPVFTVGWQMMEGLRAHGVPAATRKERVLELLREVDIPEPEKSLRKYPHEFSGGQKQRVMIAMALALRPKLIIADEPTTALDVTVQAEILDLLRRCREELGSGILIVTHNMGVVADLADRVSVMEGGRVVESGSTEEIFYAPQHPYTKQLLAAVPHLSVNTSVAPADESHSAQLPVTDGDSKHGLPGTVRVSQSDIPEFQDSSSLPTALKISDLDIVYPGSVGTPAFHAVHKVSFEIRAGEVLGLVGESGSGKSTIGKAIVGLAPIKHGTVEVLGTNLRNLRGAKRKSVLERIGVIFQDPATSLNPYLTVGECVVESLVIHKRLNAQALRKRAGELLDAVQLPRAFSERYPHQLSGGQRQRVGIARALALSPELIIADEPTSALDVSVQAKVLDLFIELQREMNFATLFISHDLAVVEALSNRVAVLRNGRLVEVGPTSRVLAQPNDDYTRRLIAAVPVPDPRLQRVKREEYRREFLLPEQG